MKSKLWHFRMPGMVYDGDLRFTIPLSERDARAELRDRGDLKQLPRGTEFWT